MKFIPGPGWAKCHDESGQLTHLPADLLQGACPTHCPQATPLGGADPATPPDAPELESHSFQMSCFLTQSTMGLLAVLVLSLLSAKLLEANEEEILPSRTHHLGGSVSIPPQSSEVQAAARLATEKFSSKSRSKMLFRLLDVTSAEMQVTNIITYKIWATIGKTKCPKSTDADLESCMLGKRRLSCKFEVTYDPRTEQHKVPISDCKKTPAAAR